MDHNQTFSEFLFFFWWIFSLGFFFIDFFFFNRWIMCPIRRDDETWSQQINQSFNLTSNSFTVDQWTDKKKVQTQTVSCLNSRNVSMETMFFFFCSVLLRSRQRPLLTTWCTSFTSNLFMEKHLLVLFFFQFYSVFYAFTLWPTSHVSVYLEWSETKRWWCNLSCKRSQNKQRLPWSSTAAL